MGFFRGLDRIGRLSHSAGVITLALPSLSLVNRATIRGQQYDFRVLTRTIATDLTPAPNTLNFVYLLVSGGTVVLRCSASAPSVYILANPQAKFIGAFYADVNSAFGGKFYDPDKKIETTIGITGNSGFLNASVQGILAMNTISSHEGFAVLEQGAYNAATGLFATRQPKIYAPMAGEWQVNAEVAWTTNIANFTNTWQAYVYRNGALSFVVARNGDGGNQAGGLNFMGVPLNGKVEVSANDLIDIRGMQDLTSPVGTYIRSASLSYRSTLTPQDL